MCAFCTAPRTLIPRGAPTRTEACPRQACQKLLWHWKIPTMQSLKAMLPLRFFRTTTISNTGGPLSGRSSCQHPKRVEFKALPSKHRAVLLSEREPGARAFLNAVPRWHRQMEPAIFITELGLRVGVADAVADGWWSKCDAVMDGFSQHATVFLAGPTSSKRCSRIGSTGSVLLRSSNCSACACHDGQRGMRAN